MQLSSFVLSLSEAEVNEALQQFRVRFSYFKDLKLEFVDDYVILHARVKKFITVPVHMTVRLSFQSSFLIFRVGDRSIRGRLKQMASQFILERIAAQFDPRIVQYSDSKFYIDINSLLRTLQIRSNCTIQRFDLIHKILYLELKGQIFVNVQALLTGSVPAPENLT